jgi:pyridoxal biosynthesis lyase PdxS
MTTSHFSIFNGGLFFEIENEKQAHIAQNAGASGVIIDMSISPLHPEYDHEELEKVLHLLEIPVIAPFRPGHIVEAEVLLQYGMFGAYADSRFEAVQQTKQEFSFPILEDISTLKEYTPNKNTPVLRKETLEEIIYELQNFTLPENLILTGPIETISDLVLIKRLNGNTFLLPKNIFEYENSEKYAQKLVLASLFWNDTEKLISLMKPTEE